MPRYAEDRFRPAWCIIRFIRCGLKWGERAAAGQRAGLQRPGKGGIFFVVAELTVKYRRPALYDETLDLTNGSAPRITPARVEHTYTLKRPSTGLVLCEGTTILPVSMPRATRRIARFYVPGRNKAARLRDAIGGVQEGQPPPNSEYSTSRSSLAAKSWCDRPPSAAMKNTPTNPQFLG